MFEVLRVNNETNVGYAKIRVVGVGGGGCNAVNTMIQPGLTGVEYIVANTDMQALNASLAPTKVQLGVEITKGLGAGANPEVGRKAALDEYEKLSEILRGSDMVFITAGMGGGTGTGAAPVIAKLAKELGALTVGVVTKPFMFEGKKRSRIAEQGIASLEDAVDSLITIPNQKLLQIAGENLSLIETFKRADEVLLNAVRGISDLINNTGHINADFADVSTVMANKGLALMGTGIASGDNRAVKAATEAISSPLLEDITIDGATGIIINITGNSALTMHETNEAVTLIMEAADEDAEIIYGTVIDDNMGDKIKVTVVATGLGGQDRVSALGLTPSQPHTNSHVQAQVQQPQQQHAPIKREEKIEREQERKFELSEDNSENEAKLITRPVVNKSKLVESIKEAASRYEASKGVSTVEKESVGIMPAYREMNPSASTVSQGNLTGDNNRPSLKTNLSRAKSIAEKLGFINFDEEELDTPSFLRKDENKRPHKENEVRAE